MVKICLNSCLLILLMSPKTFAKSSDSFGIKAAYLYQFLRYSHLPENDKPLVIGLVTVQDIKPYFLSIEGKLFNKQEIKIQQIFDLNDKLTCCDLLYFAPGTESMLQLFIDKLPKGVITVADNQLKNGELTMIRLERKNSKLKFTVYSQNAKRKAVVFSSRLLRVALEVY